MKIPLPTLHLNIASLSRHFEDFQNFLSLLKRSFNIISVSEHIINKKLIKIDNFFLVMYSVITKLKGSMEEQVFLYLTNKHSRNCQSWETVIYFY